MRYTKKEKEIIASLSTNLPDSLNPYKDLAIKHNISEYELFEIIDKFKKNNIFRRFASLIRHYKTSYSFNALILWCVSEELVHCSGEHFATLTYVSHCYQRKTAENWPYNLYTMIHAQSKNELEERIQFMSLEIDCINYKILNTIRELKKESIIYFENILEK